MDNKDLQDIKDLMKDKIAVSNFQLNSNMDKKIKKISLIKNLSTIAACIIFTSGIIFSNQISNKIYDLAIAKEVEKVAINTKTSAKFNVEYSESNEEIIDLENNNQGLSQDNLKIKVDDIVMDDNNLKVTFNIELSDEISKKINAQKGVEAAFPDLLITDENGNILYCQDMQKVEELLNIDYTAGYSPEGNISFDEYQEKVLKENEKYFDGYVYSYVLEHSGNSIKLMYNMNLVGQEKYYPRCKNLNFEIRNIKIINDAENEFGGTKLNYQGKWNISLELPENIINRKMNTYKMIENETNGENEVILFNVLDSGTEVKLRLKAPEVTESDISPQLKLINELELENPTVQIRDYFVDELMASEEYRKYQDDLSKKYMIQEAYIQDETGKRYELHRGAYANGGGTISEDNFYEPALVFNFKERDIKENLKLHVKYFDVDYEFDIVKEAEI